MSKVLVRLAVPDDQDAIIEVAKMSRYTKGVNNPHYLSEGAYTKGFIAVAEQHSYIGLERMHDVQTLGFYCVRHLVRDTYTSLYYIGTRTDVQGKGVGFALVSHIFKKSPHDVIKLVCDKRNEETLSWYLRHGFVVDMEDTNKSGEVIMRLSCRREDWGRGK